MGVITLEKILGTKLPLHRKQTNSCIYWPVAMLPHRVNSSDLLTQSDDCDKTLKPYYNKTK